MKTNFFLLLLIITLLFSVGCAQDSTVPGSVTNTITIPLSDDNNACSYIYHYEYPLFPNGYACSENINSFYAYLIDDTMNYGINMDIESIMFSNPQTNHYKNITYQITCNNQDYISFLFSEESGTEKGIDSLRIYGHTFSVRNSVAGSTLTLPGYLDLLSSEETADEWLAERQTEKVDNIVRDLIWDRITHNHTIEEFIVFEDITRNSLDDFFYPEEDFYLNENGDTVFYIYPGRIADEEYGFINFSISRDEILDEL